MSKECQLKVERHLLSGGSITQLQALSKRFDWCGRLAPIIDRLRDKYGRKAITTEMVKTGRGIYGKYKMPL